MINASHFPPREIQTTTILAKFKKASSCMKYPLSRFVDHPPNVDAFKRPRAVSQL